MFCAILRNFSLESRLAGLSLPISSRLLAEKNFTPESFFARSICLQSLAPVFLESGEYELSESDIKAVCFSFGGPLFLRLITPRSFFPTRN